MQNGSGQTGRWQRSIERRAEERAWLDTAPPPPSGQHFNEKEEPRSSLYVDYYRTLVRHRRVVLGFAFGGLLAAVLLHLTTQPIYRSRTSLDIQSLNGDFMNLRSVDPTGASSPSDTNVQTQIKLLQSDTLIGHVEDRLILEPHQAFLPKNDLLSRIERLLHLGGKKTIPFETMLHETVQGVKVKPLGITRLVEITCDSWEPAFASRFCNTLTNEFQAEDLESRGAEAKRTSDWLMRQSEDVKQKSEESQRRLFAATGGNGLILAQQTDTVGEDRLRQLQSELVRAQAERMEKEAQLSVARNSSAESTPNVVSDPAYAAARTRLAELQTQVASLVPPLTEENPKIIHLRSQISQLQETMTAQRGNSSQRLQNEYAAAKHREDLIGLSYRTTEQSVSSDLEKGSQVQLLRRELESEQQLYQLLLQRAKEAGFAAAMHASTIRTVDEAKTPLFPAYPQRLTAMAVGLILGLGVGIAAAFLKDRNRTVVRSPGEAERLLRIDELGVIPSSVPSRAALQILRPATTPLTPFLNPTRLALPGAIEDPVVTSTGWDDPFSLVAEAYRNATLSIMLSGANAASRVYVVASPNTGEGKSTIITNLGIALSKANLRVALIDGDLRKPSLHRTLSVPNSFGLRDLLRGDADPAMVPVEDFCKTTAFPGLWVVPAGSGKEEVVRLLHSPGLKTLTERLRSEFDVILVDTPPLLHMVDARLLAGVSDGAILVLRSGITTRELAGTARDLLVNDHVRIIGTVLNDFNAAKQGQKGYYKTYYAYAHQSPEKKVAAGS